MNNMIVILILLIGIICVIFYIKYNPELIKNIMSPPSENVNIVPKIVTIDPNVFKERERLRKQALLQEEERIRLRDLSRLREKELINDISKLQERARIVEQSQQKELEQSKKIPRLPWQQVIDDQARHKGIMKAAHEQNQLKEQLLIQELQIQNSNSVDKVRELEKLRRDYALMPILQFPELREQEIILATIHDDRQRLDTISELIRNSYKIKGMYHFAKYDNSGKQLENTVVELPPAVFRFYNSTLYLPNISIPHKILEIKNDRIKVSIEDCIKILNRIGNSIKISNSCNDGYTIISLT